MTSGIEKIQNLEPKQETVLGILKSRLEWLQSDLSGSIRGLENVVNRFETPKENGDKKSLEERPEANQGMLPEIFRIVEKIEELQLRSRYVLDKLETIV